MEKDIKILKFNKKSEDLLTDDEIVKIFMGLLRLMKKSAEYSAIKSVEQKIKNDAKKINDLNVKLEKRTKQLEKLLKLNDELASKIKTL